MLYLHNSIKNITYSHYLLILLRYLILNVFSSIDSYKVDNTNILDLLQKDTEPSRNRSVSSRRADGSLVQYSEGVCLLFLMPEMSCFIFGVSLLMVSYSIVMAIDGWMCRGVLPHPRVYSILYVFKQANCLQHPCNILSSFEVICSRPMVGCQPNKL